MRQMILVPAVLSLLVVSCGRGNPPKLDEAAVREMQEKAEREAKEKAIDDLKPQIAAISAAIIKGVAAKIARENDNPTAAGDFIWEAVCGLVEEMKTQDEMTRAFTAETARQLTGKKLGDTYEEWNKWIMEREAAEQKNPEDRARALVQDLGRRRGLVGFRERAEKQLLSMGDPAIAPLVEAAIGQQIELRSHACEILMKMKSPRAYQTLIDLVLKGPPEKWQPATDALAAMVDAEAFRYFIPLLRDPDRRARDLGWHVIEHRHGESVPGTEFVPALIETLGFEDEQSRRCAVILLAKIPGKEAYEGLVAALSDSAPDVRRCAISALGERAIIFPEERKAATKLTIEALSNPDRNIQWGAVYAIGRLACVFPEERNSSAKLIIACLVDKDPDFVSYVERVLHMFTGQGLGKDPAAWQKWLEEEGTKGD